MSLSLWKIYLYRLLIEKQTYAILRHASIMFWSQNMKLLMVEGSCFSIFREHLMHDWMRNNKGITNTYSCIHHMPLFLNYEVQNLIVSFWSYLISNDGNKFLSTYPLLFQKWVHAHRNTHIRALWLPFLSLDMCWFSDFLYLEFEWNVMDGDWLLRTLCSFMTMIGAWLRMRIIELLQTAISISRNARYM